MVLERTTDLKWQTMMKSNFYLLPVLWAWMCYVTVFVKENTSRTSQIELVSFISAALRLPVLAVQTILFQLSNILRWLFSSGDEGTAVGVEMCLDSGKMCYPCAEFAGHRYPDVVRTSIYSHLLLENWRALYFYIVCTYSLLIYEYIVSNWDLLYFCQWNKDMFQMIWFAFVWFAEVGVTHT